MPDFDVVVWRGALSDGAHCYAAWCSSVNVGAQGDTETAALQSITAIIADAVSDAEFGAAALPDASAAAADLAGLMRELADAGTPYRVHRVPLAAPALAGV